LHSRRNLLADRDELFGDPAVEGSSNRRVIDCLCENRQLDLSGPANLVRLFDLE